MMKLMPCDDWLTLEDESTLLLLFKRAILSCSGTTTLPQTVTSRRGEFELLEWLCVVPSRLPALAVFDLLVSHGHGPRPMSASGAAVVDALLRKKIARPDDQLTRIQLLLRWGLVVPLADSADLSLFDRDDLPLIHWLSTAVPPPLALPLPPLRESIVPFILQPAPVVDLAAQSPEWAPLIATMLDGNVAVPAAPGVPNRENPPLHCALERGAPLPVIRILLSLGANVNQQRSIDGSPPLHLSQSFECDKLLISAGANPRLCRSSDGRMLAQARPHEFDIARTWYLDREAPRLNKMVVHTTLLHVCIALAPLFVDLAPEIVDRIVILLPGMRVLEPGVRLALIVRVSAAYANKCDGQSVGLQPLDRAERTKTPPPPEEETLPPDELKQRILSILPDLKSRVTSVALAAAVAVRRLVTVPAHTEAVVKLDVVPLLVDLIELDSPKVTFEVLWSFTNISMDFVPELLKHNVVPLVMTLTQSSDSNVCLQALWTLCNIGHDSNEGRSALVKAGVHRALSDLINKRTEPLPAPILQQASELCLAVCGGKDKNRLLLMQPLALKLLYASEDAKVLADIAKSFSLIGNATPWRLVEIGVVPRLIDLLHHPSHDVRLEALVAIGSLASGSEQETDAVATPTVCARLLELFQSPVVNVVKEAAFVVSNLCAGTVEQKKLVIDCGIVEGLIPLIVFAEKEVQREAAWSVANLSSTKDVFIITSLVDAGLLTVMLNYALEFPDDSQVGVIVMEFLERVKGDHRFADRVMEHRGGIEWIQSMVPNHPLALAVAGALKLKSSATTTPTIDARTTVSHPAEQLNRRSF